MSEKALGRPTKINFLMVYGGGETENLPHPLKQMRYGDNPHQECSVGQDPEGPQVNVLQEGRGLSFTNYLDLASSFATAFELSETMKYLKDDRVHATVINKHTDPAGFAVGETPAESYELAFDTDPKSVFGGVMAIDHFDKETAEAILQRKHFLDVLSFKGYEEEAVKLMEEKRKNLRIVDLSQFDSTEKIYYGVEVRKIPLNLTLVEEFNWPTFYNSEYNWKVQSEYVPNDDEDTDAIVAWIAAKAVRSNSFAFVKDGQGVAQCGGQSNREDSAKFAGIRATEFGNELDNSAGATDSFLYDKQAVEILHDMGVDIVVNPGRKYLSPQSVEQDEPILEKINKYNMGMIMPSLIVNGEEGPWRVFRH